MTDMHIRFLFFVFLCMFVVTTLIAGECLTERMEQIYAQNNILLDKMENISRCTCQTYSKPTSVHVVPYKSTWKDCADVFKSGHKQSGVFKVKPLSLTTPVEVFCDTSSGGGWTVFQRRRDGTVSFNHTWNEYKNGFGDLRGEFWLGNDIVAAMTANTAQNLRVDLMNFDWETRYAQYANFKLGSEEEKYKLNIGAYSGTAGDSFLISGHNGAPFSAPDRENDKDPVNHDGLVYAQGWWFTHGASVLLNSRYVYTRINSHQNIWWYTWEGYNSLKATEIKFRPMNY